MLFVWLMCARGGSSADGYQLAVPLNGARMVSCRGLFQNVFGQLIGAQGFDLGPSTTTERGNVILPVTVHTRNGDALRVRFVLRKKDVGRNEGCWMTLSLLN